MTVDVVIVSDSKNDNLKKITENALVSLFNSETSIEFKVFLIESSDYDFSHIHKNIQQIKLSEFFNYHAYLNVGRKLGNSKYVCLCNNDVVFYLNWATNIIIEMEMKDDLLSASPKSITHHRYLDDSYKVTFGYEIGSILCGWCIFQKREIYDIIGDLAEDIPFYCCDTNYSMQLKQHNLKHALIGHSTVDHLHHQTFQTLNKRSKISYGLKRGRMLFDRKFNH